MAEKEYTVIAPDGKEITLIGPEGATQQEVIAQAQKLYQPQAKPVTMTEQMVGLGSPIARFVKGAVVDPLLGLNQLVAETGILGETVKQQARGNVKAYEQATQQARKRVGSEGFDVVQLGGAIAGGLLTPIKTPTPASALARIEQAGAQGALFGGITPVVNTEDYLSEKLTQIGSGAAAGALLGSGIELGTKGYQVLKELTKPLSEQGKLQLLRDYIKELSGGDTAKLTNALRSAEEIVPGSRPTAAEALSNQPQAAGLVSYQERLSQMPERGISGKFATRTAEQEQARRAAIGTIAQDDAALAAARAERSAVTTPMREEALTQANIAGELQPKIESEIAAKFQSKAQALKTQGQLGTEAAQQRVLAETFTPVPGYPRFPARYSENLERVAGNVEGSKLAGDIVKQRQAEIDFKKFQLQSLGDNGFYPLRTEPIKTKIESILSKPGERASDVVQNTLTSLKDKLAKFTDTNTGVIDSRDLYTIRKEIGNDIKKFASESQNWDAKLTAGLEKNIKSYIDNAIESAGGADWKKYLTTFQQASEKINRIEVGQALEQKLQTSLGDKERAGAFATAVQNAASTIKRSTGQARFNKLDEILTPKEIETVDKVLADLQRKANAEQLAAQSTAKQLSLEGGIETPNLLNRAASITNAVLKAVKKDATVEINKLAAEMMLDPRKLAAFIDGVPKQNADIILKAFVNKLNPQLQNAFTQQFVLRTGAEISKQNENQE